MSMTHFQGVIVDQKLDIQRLNDENKQLSGQCSSKNEVDHVRQMLFELQAQMATHTTEVLKTVTRQPSS